MADNGVANSGNRWAARSVLRWQWAATLSTVLMLVVLAYAPTKEYTREWRRVQKQYNRLATPRRLREIDVHIRQTWIPSAQRADRCGTCHLGAAGEAPLPKPKVFNAHPRVPHSQEEYGCTYCHAGQGLATERDDAHGSAGSWHSPIYPERFVEAGCGACHTGIRVPLPEQVEDVADLREGFACDACHAAGKPAPGIEDIALRGLTDDWVDRHRGMALPSDEARPLSDMDEDERAVLDAWLATKVGAPHLARGKQMFFGLGCLGCHRRGTAGGDVGPELTAIGTKDARELAGDDAAGPDTLPGWLRAHLLDPQAVVQGSRMPPLDRDRIASDSDIDDIVTFLLSLRAEVVPDDLTPKDKARIDHSLGRDFPTTGRGLFVTFCSGCHGADGQGLELKTLGLVTPMIATRGFLSAVSPRYIRATVENGRRGRFMPAFGAHDGGLSSDEVTSLVGWVWEQGFEAAPYAAPMQPPSSQHGAEVFAERCAGCHARGNEAARFGRDLTAPGGMDELPDDVFWSVLQHGWVEMGMPAFAYLPPEEIHDLIAYLRAGTPAPALPETEADASRAYIGARLWDSKCASCHGGDGEGGDAPLLNSGPYLAWASDVYLAQRITHHTGQAATSAIGAPSESDVAALLGAMRHWSGDVTPARAAPPTADAVTRGATLFADRCTECHGPDGAGLTGPAIASADFWNLVSRPFVVMTILEGRKGTPMLPWRTAEEKPVTVQDAFDIADYLRSKAPGHPGERESK